MSRVVNRFVIPLLVFGVLVAVFAVALKRAPEKQKEGVRSALIGKPAPAFTLPDLLQPGATISSAAFKGRWVLLNVWASWCPSCRVEHPVFLDIQRAGKVAMVGLNYQDNGDDARQWLAELGNPYTAIAVDREGRAAIDFGVYGAPESFLINPDGVIVHKVVGAVTAEAWRDTMLPMIEGVAK
jgi:cytochrome c biogenesis protein CcmG, thiol:disulfide interchange protein DsbE